LDGLWGCTGESQVLSGGKKSKEPNYPVLMLDLKDVYYWVEEMLHLLTSE